MPDTIFSRTTYWYCKYSQASKLLVVRKRECSKKAIEPLTRSESATGEHDCLRICHNRCDKMSQWGLEIVTYDRFHGVGHGLSNYKDRSGLHWRNFNGQRYINKVLSCQLLTIFSRMTTQDLTEHALHLIVSIPDLCPLSYYQQIGLACSFSGFIMYRA